MTEPTDAELKIDMRNAALTAGRARLEGKP